MTLNALYDQAQSAWNRNDGRGFWLSVLGPLLAVLLINASMALFGWNEADPAYDAVPFNPPGWLVGFVWLIIYPMWGAARWYAQQTGVAGRRTSRWVVALMLYGLAYPFAVELFDTSFSAWASAGALALAVATTWQLRRISKRSAALVAPSILWLAFASILGFTALS